MFTVYYGSRHEAGHTLESAPDLLAVRTHDRKPVTVARSPVPTPAAVAVQDGVPVAEYPDAGVVVYRVPVGPERGGLTLRKEALRRSANVRFAGEVLVDAVSREPVVYTENLFVKFADTVDPEDAAAVLRDAGLKLKRRVAYTTNGFFVGTIEGTGRKVFELSESLRQREDVEFCHPELVRPRRRRAIFPEQWHLRRTVVGGQTIDAHADVEAAHQVTRGEGVVVAIVDDGVEIDHPEFSGSGKIVAPRDVTVDTNDPRPKDPAGTGRRGDNHGTACAGVACANGDVGASGVAPAARLLPVRLSSGLGSQDEADAIAWAADHGADIISCSWGPADGEWWNPADPRHRTVVPLPASTRLALEHAATSGRGGKGCAIFFAAGNGNESVDNDGYASSPVVIAVAACNDRSRRSVYSDFGHAIWCSFPSNDLGEPSLNHPNPLTPGIWTTDRAGLAGYNPGSGPAGGATGNFTNSFGGTSSACPGAAGVAALVLAVNPALNRVQLRDLLRRACDRIDPTGGAYDANGRSALYGFGRLNAATAVALAAPAPRNVAVVRRQFDVLLPDLQTVRRALDVAEPTPVAALAVDLEIRHTFIGDLRITLEPPPAAGVPPVVLHDRAGGPTRDLKRRYDATNVPALAAWAGRSAQGTWTLQVVDLAAGDSGTLVAFGLELAF